MSGFVYVPRFFSFWGEYWKWLTMADVVLSQSWQSGRDEDKLYLTGIEDHTNKWTMQLRPKIQAPCLWLLAKAMPGQVCMSCLLSLKVDSVRFHL